VQRHATELEQRVAERTARLEAANRHLETLSRLKDEFVANVSHELRTPITNIKLRQHLLNRQPDRLDEHLAVIRREILRLENTIENLLFLSRLDQQREHLDIGPVNLNELASRYVLDRVSLAESRGLELDLEIEPELLAVEADERLLGQSLSVLLTNAFNYTPAGGHVTVRTGTRSANDAAWHGLIVTDTGPGIPADEQPYLFDRFFRGKAARESGMPGTGLGLAIVQEIAEQHNGWVEVNSTGKPGQGATFAIWLPVAQITEPG
jgi:signal transduction histidine kinase